MDQCSWLKCVGQNYYFFYIYIVEFTDPKYINFNAFKYINLIHIFLSIQNTFTFLSLPCDQPKAISLNKMIDIYVQ